ncbi:hypothetical protein EYF80_058044 [Liparis tanakae]|uniref:Uncharacterized protein n=1 Tax=Liparis tanakae TaxID=230148 RepID=A0A4Z2ES92_9TELE|nr:hypothetical protein EYF80_058044 [Liparis tanakae]
MKEPRGTDLLHPVPGLKASVHTDITCVQQCVDEGHDLLVEIDVYSLFVGFDQLFDDVSNDILERKAQACSARAGRTAALIPAQTNGRARAERRDQRAANRFSSADFADLRRKFQEMQQVEEPRE